MRWNFVSARQTPPPLFGEVNKGATRDLPSVRRTFLVAFGQARDFRELPFTRPSSRHPRYFEAPALPLQWLLCYFFPFPLLWFLLLLIHNTFFSFRLLLSNSRLAFILKIGSHSHQSLHWIECVPQWCVQMMVARYIRSLNIHCDFRWLTIREFPRSFFNFFFFFVSNGRRSYMSHILGWWSESLYVYFP